MPKQFSWQNGPRLHHRKMTYPVLWKGCYRSPSLAAGSPCTNITFYLKTAQTFTRLLLVLLERMLLALALFLMLVEVDCA